MVQRSPVELYLVPTLGALFVEHHGNMLFRMVISRYYSTCVDKDQTSKSAINSIQHCVRCTEIQHG